MITKQPTNVKDLFKKEREVWLLKARDTAKELLKEYYSITIEDVLKKCPRPDYIHRNATGKVFDKDFIAIGWRRSARPLMNGRQVRVWRMNPDVIYESNYRE